MRGIILLILIALCTRSFCPAAEVSRVLKTFDFEERRLGNEELLPMHWVKLHGPGLPHYVNGRLDTERHRGGRYSFRFDLNGGSLIYRYGPRLIPVQRGAHYRVDAYCQTTPLPNARARLTVYLVDQDGRALPNTISHSALYAATQDGSSWKLLTAEVTADSPAALSLVTELELLQPELYATSKPGQRPIFQQDIYGSAWWDDITVSQVPEVALRTGHAGNIYRRDEPLRLNVLVSDRFTDDLVAQISVRNAEGKEVYQLTGAPNVRRLEGESDRRKQMVLELPHLPPGWYEARLVMNSAGLSLGTQSIAFIVLPDDGAASPPDGRFGFVATDVPFDAWGELPEVLPLLSAGRVKLAVWSAQGDVEQAGVESFDRLLKRFNELGITPTACLTEPPPALADKLNGHGWKRLLNVPDSVWQPDLAFLVSRHANHLDRWQLGADGAADFVTDPSLREVYRRVYQEFSTLVDKPDLAMPWPAWYELSGNLPATVALDLPPSILPSQLPLYVQDLGGRGDHKLSLTLELLERDRYGRDVQVRDLAQRVIYALAADARRIDLPLPLRATSDQAGVSTEPDELFLVMRTLITTLSGARYRGRVAIAEGVEAFLFDRGGQGIMALWDRGDTAGAKDLALNLGTRPVSIDLWGNITPLVRPPGEHQGRVSLHIGPMPIFLVDIDGPQAQLRASVAMDRPLLESSFRPHTRRIRFTNAYPQAITGTLHIKAPPGWTLNPPTFNFSLNPGETFDRELTMQFPYNSFAGNKTLGCEFYIQGEKDPMFTVPIALKLGLSDVGMQTSALRDGRDIFVQQIITNYGDSPISYSAFAMYPEQARQERLVTNLAPGASTIRRYRFNNVEPTRGAKVRMGLKELEGTRILNDEVEVQ